MAENTHSVFCMGLILSLISLSGLEAATSMGTGFMVHPDGYIVTNNHVIVTEKKLKNGKVKVKRCGKISVMNRHLSGQAKVIASDPVNDLAVIKMNQRDILNANKEVPSSSALSEQNGWQDLSTLSSKKTDYGKGRDRNIKYIRFSAGDIRPGDNISLFGYPLGNYVSSQLKVNAGVVVAMVGPGDDSNLMQIDAASNPGNSGGPVLDGSGHLVGVLVGHLKNVEGFNFAIKSSMAEIFLTSRGIPIEKAEGRRPISRSTLYNRALEAVFLVICSN
jgi:S1-C subfamily serine protease